jgi:CRISPR-associated protein Cmr4
MHAGSGADLGVVDLPIQRERSTGYPKVEGSSLKGALRAAFREGTNTSEEDRALLFGPDSAETDLHAGAVGVTDARILLFPVKSVRGVFAWVTSPAVLRKWKDELSHAGVDVPWDVPAEETAAPGSDLAVDDDGETQTVVLEEYAFDLSASERAQQVGRWIGNHVVEEPGLDARLAVLDDDAFRDFVEMGTEVITRTKIDAETGTVAEGQLFTEEYLPAEAVLYFLAMASPLRVAEDNATLGEVENPASEDVLQYFDDHCPSTIQIGANATIGKGLVEVRR